MGAASDFGKCPRFTEGIWRYKEQAQLLLCNSVCSTLAGRVSCCGGLSTLCSRIERLLTQAPSSTASPDGSTTAFNTVFQSQTSFEPPALPLDAKTHGHLMISLTSLRQYAERHLKKRSAQREAFLADLADLEDAKLSKDDKLRVVERMWRSWGQTLGWGSPRFA